ncbi:MAG TPA: LysM peptidoglycan-binding domain-containing protein [Anaerolineales bacterium]|nr:LysM peptidoglycan-binding domain-containing protein [Anaerolineales bacterium]
MVNKKIGLRLIVLLLLGTILATACTQSYSQAPAATPTLIPPGLFVSPLPTGVDAMQLVADFGTQTAEALNGTTATPEAVTATAGTASAATDTPTLQSGTFITPLSGSSTPAVAVTFTPAPLTAVPLTSTPVGTVIVPTVSAGVPATYTLQQGEFPYCIARRYNVDPNELKSLNGLRDWEIVQPGLVLQMPQTGNPFPGVRALHNHPDTYTVTGNGDTTVYGVACYYGDVFPETIAQANNLPLSTVLTAGQQLTIP